MSRLRVYVAGSSKELERAEWAMARVGDAGAELTEDWAVHVREAIRASGSANEGLTPARRAELASLDFDGVASAHVVWLLSPETQSTGAWVEMGIAIARGIPVIASGPGSQRCIFGALVREVMGDMEAAAIVAKMAKERV